MSTDATQRASDKLARLAGQGLDLVSFWRASTEVLVSAVPHYRAPCWFTLDPASLLVTSHFDEGIPELPPQWPIHEYYQQPPLARQHDPGWGPGADRRPAHPGR